MRNLKTFLIICLCISIVHAFSMTYYRQIIEPLYFTSKGITEIEIELPSIEIDETDLFLDAIAHSESSNRYTIVNRFGYMGKYQFGRLTLKGLGYKVTRKEFLNSPEIQEQAMLDLLLHNKKILQNYIDKWDGKRVQGKKVTESGILAAAHLVGPSKVKRFFDSGKDSQDGNGTKLTKYLTQFSGYDLNLEQYGND